MSRLLGARSAPSSHAERVPRGARSAPPRACRACVARAQRLVLKYHNGVLLKGNYTLHLLWYGRFSLSQRAIIADFIRSLSPPASSPLPLSPSVASWWQTTSRYRGGSVRISLGRQLLDESYSLGKTLTDSHLQLLAGRAPHRNAITAVHTSDDVALDGFCGRCGTHRSGFKKKARYPFLWVGNSAAQCPGQCAWPFHQPMYGPQSPPLVAPNGDVGVDGMVINLATLLAGTVTNPFGNGYFQGPPEAPLEAVTACTGMFGKGAYPGYPGEVLVDQASGASYNARGVYGRKYLLPAMWDPATSQCATLV